MIGFNIGVNPSNHVNLKVFFKLLLHQLSCLHLLTQEDQNGAGGALYYYTDDQFRNAVYHYCDTNDRVVTINEEDFVNVTLENGYYVDVGGVHSWYDLTTLTMTLKLINNRDVSGTTADHLIQFSEISSENLVRRKIEFYQASIDHTRNLEACRARANNIVGSDINVESSLSSSSTHTPGGTATQGRINRVPPSTSDNHSGVPHTALFSGISCVDKIFGSILFKHWPKSATERDDCYKAIEEGIRKYKSKEINPNDPPKGAIDEKVEILAACLIHSMTITEEGPEIALTDQLQEAFCKRARNVIDFMFMISKYSNKFRSELPKKLRPTTEEECRRYKEAVVKAVDNYYTRNEALQNETKPDQIVSFTYELLVEALNEQSEGSVYTADRYAGGQFRKHFQNSIQDMYNGKRSYCVIC